MTHPALPYVVPMATFMLLLVVGEHLGLGPWEYPLRVALLAIVLFVFSRRVIDLRVSRWVGSTLVGVAVFAIWIAPDVLWPGYRDSWIFQNAMTGTVTSSVPAEYRDMQWVLWSRALRAVILVPIIEELFWRAWMMRWLVEPDFRKVPLGTFTPLAFGATAVLFASEHGAYWEVGLAAGLIYNWWMIRTRSLGDCILAHAVTNGLLSAHVVLNDQWQYW
jgi:CAAX prenyl protease-like protein